MQGLLNYQGFAFLFAEYRKKNSNQQPKRKAGNNMTMKKFMVYLDDGKDVFKCAIPAKDEKTAREYVKGNGEVIAIKDVTSDYPISAEKVGEALAKANFGKYEMDLIIRALQQMNICE